MAKVGLIRTPGLLPDATTMESQSFSAVWTWTRQSFAGRNVPLNAMAVKVSRSFAFRFYGVLSHLYLQFRRRTIDAIVTYP